MPVECEIYDFCTYRFLSHKLWRPFEFCVCITVNGTKSW